MRPQLPYLEATSPVIPMPYLEAVSPVIPMPYLEATSPVIPRRPPSPREAFLEHDADAEADEGSPLPYLATTPSSAWPALAGAHALAPRPPPLLLPNTAPQLLMPVSASASVDGIAHPDIASSWALPVDASASSSALTVALGATPTSQLFTAACSTFTPARAPEHSAVVGAIDETAVDSAAIFEREIGTTLPKKAAAQLASVWRAEGSGGVDLPVEVYLDYARRFGCAGFGLPLVLMLFGLSQVIAPDCNRQLERLYERLMTFLIAPDYVAGLPRDVRLVARSLDRTAARRAGRSRHQSRRFGRARRLHSARCGDAGGAVGSVFSRGLELIAC